MSAAAEPVRSAASPRWLIAGRRIAPGVALAFLIAWTATLAGKALGISPVLLALVGGVALSPAAAKPTLGPGLDVSARQVLRLGVVLMGAKITLGQIGALGGHALLITVAALVLTLAVGFGLGRAFGLSKEHAIISAGAVGICGASAALAIAATLPRDEARERQVAMTVALVTLAGTAAMLVYPWIARSLALDARQTAVFLGASLHEMAQVAGAGYAVTPQVGAEAVTVKLVRIACLAPAALALQGLVSQGGAPGAVRPPIVPWFIAGFIVLAVIASLGLLPAPAAAGASRASQWCVLGSIAALGARISPAQVLRAGLRPAAAVLVSSGLLALGVIIALRFGS